MLEGLFLKVLDMSVAASCCIVVVMLLRLVFKRLPKLFSYMLWLIVLVRFLCPVFMESSRFGLLPSAGRQQSIWEEVGESVRGYLPANPDISGDFDKQESWQELFSETESEHYLNPDMGKTDAKASIWKVFHSVLQNRREERWIMVCSLIWFGVICVIFVYSVASVQGLKRRLGTARRIEEDIYESEQVEAPFVYGLLKPCIYLPAGLAGAERSYILTHERVHIKRKDYLFKPLFFAAVCIHWFNPFAWAAWKLMCKDMEMACDEAVLSELGERVRKDYSEALLKLSSRYPVFLNGPLAFGENDTKSRVKNIVSYKKPGVWVIGTALLLFGATAAFLLTNHRAGEEPAPTIGQEKETSSGDWQEIDSYNQMVRALERGEELTWERLTQLAAMEKPTLEDYAGYHGAEWSERTGDLATIRESLEYYLTDSETETRYWLYVMYYIEDNRIGLVSLTKLSDGSSILLYNDSYESDRGVSADILAFRQHTEKMSDWVAGYTVPKAEDIMEGEYSPVGGYGYGGIDFTWTGKSRYIANGTENTSEVWKSAGGIMRYPLLSIDVPDVPDFWSFEKGELTDFSFRGLNHTSKVGETARLAGCEESAVVFCLNHDLYTASEIGMAEATGEPIPEDEQTVDMWYAAIAREGAPYAYVVYLSGRYYTEEEVREFARSVHFTEEAWEE